MTTAPAKIDADALMRIKSLELRARRILEGYMQGMHRSPYHGSSVEFSEYRGYTEGDDPRHIDWKLYARSDRYCIKKFEAETNLVCHLVVDQSRSMQFTSLSYNKADYAATLGATFAQFLFSQGDTVGLVTFTEAINAYVPPKRSHGQMHQLVLGLEKTPDSVGTNVKKSLDELVPILKKRGLIVLISDLLDEADTILPQLAFLRSCGHDLIVFQVLDPAERQWSYDENAVFEDLETGERIQLDPTAAAADYMRQLEAHQARIEKHCRGLAIDLVQVTTSQSFHEPLNELLVIRSRINRQRRSS